MKKLFILVIAFGVMSGSISWAQDLGTLLPTGLGSLTENVTANPYVQVGIQRLGANINLPVDAEGPIAGLLQIDQLDLSIQDANFWTGTAGVTIKAGELLSLFGALGGSLNRPFIVSGEVPISLGPVGTRPRIEFTSSRFDLWYAQGGVGLGPILLGIYGDHVGFKVGDPRQGSVPLANQTLRGDVITTTIAPYVGIAIPASSDGLFMVIYSPLAVSDTTIVLRTSSQDLAELQYKWNEPGDLLSFNFLFNVDLMDAVAVGIWANYAWMEIRGNAELDFVNSTNPLSRQKEVSASFTKYVLQGGATLGVTF